MTLSDTLDSGFDGRLTVDNSVQPAPRHFDVAESTAEGVPPKRALVEFQVVRLIRLALLVGGLYIVSRTGLDPDLWGHVLFGRDIVTQGAIHTVDPYSFTSDRAWINHEWLAEVLLYLAFAAGGTLGIVALKTGVVASAFGIVSRTLNRAGLKPVHHDRLMAIGIVVAMPRIPPARPQVFSLLLFAILLHSLSAADRGSRRWLIAIPPTMALWANFHGGFVVGLGVLFLWILVRLLQRADIASKAALLSLALLSVGATLLNPYGVGLWQFLWSTVGLSRPNISDWMPMFSTSPYIWVPFLVAATVCASMILKARARLDKAYVLIILALLLGAIRVCRLDAFFGIAMVMLAGPAVATPETRKVARADTRTVFTSWHRPFFLAAAAIVITGASFSYKERRCIPVTSMPESATISFFKSHTPQAHVLTFFNWGEYAIWHLGPNLRVSMDGRRETVYSDQLFTRHGQLYENGPDAAAFVRRLAPDFVWLPSDRPVVQTLVKDGWHIAFRGPVSTILSRHPGPTIEDSSSVNTERCFPNP